MQRHRSRRRLFCRAALLIAASSVFAVGTARAEAPPITIGFGMSLTGGLAANGKSALLAMKIWAEDENAKGGLLGRPVKLVYYDEQSDPSTVPGIYTKLLDVDKVDLVVGGYATNTLAPAMPVVMQHGATFIGLFGLAVNAEFQYPRYFSMIPAGPDPKAAFSKDFFELAAAQSPKPKTVAIVARRHRILAQRRRRGARQRDSGRLHDRLRRELSAQDDGLLADRAGDPGGGAGHRLRRLVSARQRRHPAGRPRDRAAAENCSAAAWSGCRARR